MSFRNMCRFCWALLILFAGPVINSFSQSGTPTSPADQTDAPPETLTVVLSDVSFSPEFLEGLLLGLAHNGYELYILPEAEYAADPEAAIETFRPALRFFRSESGEIYIELLIHPMRERSPILMDLPEPVQISGQWRFPTRVATQYALYAMSDCTGATNEIPMSLFEGMFDEFNEDDEAVTDAFNSEQARITLLQFETFYLTHCQRLNNFNLVWSPVIDTVLSSPEIEIADNVYYAWNDIQQGNHERAFQQLDHLAERWKDDPLATIEILHKRSQFHALVNDFDSAMTVIEEAITLAEAAEDLSLAKQAALYVQRGQVNMLLYEWDAAIADYTMAIDLGPDEPAVAEAYYYRGIAYYTTLVDRERALPDFERYLELALYGEHRAEALQYQADIRAELEALGS